MSYAFYPSALGLLKIGTTGDKVFRISFVPEQDSPSEPTAASAEANARLQEYFAGKRTVLDLPATWQGTSFQRAVWQAICRIPYGKTATYRELAAAIGSPGALRAVGRAAGANPLAILIPCHRVIRSDGSLGGYAFGTERKKALLRLEAGQQINMSQAEGQTGSFGAGFCPGDGEVLRGEWEFS